MNPGYLKKALATCSAAVCLALSIGQTADQEKPASRPGQPEAGLSKPEQADIIADLLRAQERSRIVLPQDPGSGSTLPGATTQPAGRNEEAPLLDGTTLVERPGRLVFEGGKPLFVFADERTAPRLRAMELLPNQLLEAMEQEAGSSGPEFVISARVTRYKSRNYLLLTKVLRRIEHGNVRP